MKSWHINYARRVLENGGVIAYPTEAVMGLGCNPWNEDAVAKVLRLKRRPAGKGLIVVASNMGQLSAVVDFSKVTRQEEITGSWPGPVTWLVPAGSATPPWLTGQYETLAVRVSAHPVVRQLCDKAGLLVLNQRQPVRLHPGQDASGAPVLISARTWTVMYPATSAEMTGPAQSGMRLPVACSERE